MFQIYLYFLSNIDLLKWYFEHLYYVCLVFGIYTNNEKMCFRDSQVCVNNLKDPRIKDGIDFLLELKMLG